MRSILFVCFTIASSSTVLAQGNVINNFAQPIATTVQLPSFGVSFDANGVLQMQTHADPTGQLIAERLAAARANLPGDLARPAELRKVSIVRLQTALENLLRDGEDPSDVMQNLAGLTRITSVYCYPDQRDIIVAGPAEPGSKTWQALR